MDTEMEILDTYDWGVVYICPSLLLPSTENQNELNDDEAVEDTTIEEANPDNELKMPIKEHSSREKTAPKARPFVCPMQNCGKTFVRKYDLTKHIDGVHGKRSWFCSICDRSFTRNDAARRHVMNVCMPRIRKGRVHLYVHTEMSQKLPYDNYGKLPIPRLL